MSKLSENFEDFLMLIAEKVDDNKYLSAIKNTFTIYMPFVIVGSFSTLCKLLLCSETIGVAKWIPGLVKIAPAFTAVNFATLTVMTLPIVFLLGMQLAKKNKTPDFITGVIALLAYISVVPNEVGVIINEISGSAPGLSSSVMGAQGLFIGMILTIIVAEVFKVLYNIDRLNIKMPKEVPAQIATSFNTLIPIFITLSIFSIFGVLFKELSGVYINEYVYQIIQAPLESIFQSPLGIVAIVIFMQFFWFLGIHGGLVISPIRNPLMIAALATNIDLVEKGLTATEPITAGFWNVFVTCGGAGITLALILSLLLFGKRKEERAVAKLALAPGICGISEPLVFGLPLVLNPIYALPFIINSAVATMIALGAINIGFITPSTIDVPFGIPVILNAFIGFGWKGVIVQIVLLIVCTLIWTPFVLISNKQGMKDVK